MKKMFLAACLLCSLACFSQTTYNLDKAKTPKTKTELSEGAILTKDKATYKGTNYPVYVTANGKFFIIVQSVTTKNFYRKYFKK